MAKRCDTGCQADSASVYHYQAAWCITGQGTTLGIQFDELFKDDLYVKIAKEAIDYANQIRQCLKENGYQLYYSSPTNQTFFVIENQKMQELAQHAEFSFWEKYDENHTIVRFATSWASKKPMSISCVN